MGCHFWGNAVECHRPFILEKQAIRIISNGGFTDHYRPLFKKLNILTLPSLYILAVLVRNSLPVSDTTNSQSRI